MGDLCLTNCKDRKKLKCNRIENKEIKEKIDYECEVTENFNLSSPTNTNISIIVIILVLLAGIYFYKKK